MPAANLILRTVYLNPEVDNKLKMQAFDQGKSKNDLIRRYIDLGMRVADGAAAKKAPVKRTAKKRAYVVKAASTKKKKRA